MIVTTCSLWGTAPEDPELRRLVEGMTEGRLGYFQRRTVTSAARKLGVEPMRRLHAAGVKLAIQPDSMRAAYYPGTKRLSIGEARLDVSTLLHELGHALDDLAEPDLGGKPVLRSEVDPALQQLYRDYQGRVGSLPWWNFWSAQKWTDYGLTSPQEYVADGVMEYAQGSRKFREADPGLHGWVRGIVG